MGQGQSAKKAEGRAEQLTHQVQQRGEAVDELRQASEQLSGSAGSFEASAKALRARMERSAAGLLFCLGCRKPRQVRSEKRPDGHTVVPSSMGK